MEKPQEDTGPLATIFVGNIDNMTAREFQLLFTFAPGFETCDIRSEKRVMGFAKFSSPDLAASAIQVLNGLSIPENNLPLIAEMAKKNLMRKKRPQTASHSFEKRARTSFAPSGQTDGAFGNMMMPQFQPNAFGGQGHQLDTVGSLDGFSGMPFMGFPSGNLMDQSNMMNQLGMSMSAPTVNQRSGKPANKPCSTLFISNLPLEGRVEEELSGLFQGVPGYKTIMYKKLERGPMCLVDFVNENTAASAMEELNKGTMLSNSTKPLWFSYAKSALNAGLANKRG